MARKPQSLLIGHKCFFQPRPQVIDFLLEPGVHLANRLGQRRCSVRISPDVVPLVRLGSSTRDDHIRLVRKNVGLRAVPFVVGRLGEAQLICQRRGVSFIEVTDRRQLCEQQRLLHQRQRLDRTTVFTLDFE